ncbi:MAG: SAM-dependent methyltransferase [Victivallaceae bacterium]
MSLILLPNSLGHTCLSELPGELVAVTDSLDGLIAESFSGGMSFLKLCRIARAGKFPIAVLDKKIKRPSEYDFFLDPITAGENWGFVSDAGLPCIADPGSGLVARAYERKIIVKSLSGPCSLTTALMLSGLYCQRFSFMGYFPKDSKSREKLIKQCQSGSPKGGCLMETFVFIETPYRNEHTFLSLVNTLHENTILSVACDLSSPDQFVSTASVSVWKLRNLQDIVNRLKKHPTVFIFKIK